tara:strand:+ start:43 stop:957 length:915 start_codon:yes stop_codon:yes gene_type:complete
MAIDTIKSVGILDGSIATADIADNAVTGAKVSDTLVISSQLQTPSVAGSADTDTSVSFPGSNIVQMNNGATARHKFHNLNGNSRFEVESSSTGGSGAGGAMIRFKGSNGTAVDIASIDGSMTNGSAGGESGILSFFTMNSGTSSEKARIFSNGAMAIPNGVAIGNGINSATSNLLDDYEIGTWTPSIGGNATYTSRIATYLKVGDLVFVQCNIHVNAIGSGSGNTLSGLPFTSQNNTAPQGGVSVMYYANIATSMIWVSGYVRNNQTSIYFSGNTVSSTTIQHNTQNIFQNNARIDFSAVYKSA